MTEHVDRSVPLRAPGPGAARRVAGWLVAVAAVWAVGGAWVGAAWTVVAVWHLVRPPHPRVLTIASAWLFGAVPVLWVAGNAGRLGEVTTALVLANPVPGAVAALALALLVTGVWRDVRDLAATPAPPTHHDRKRRPE
jgi:hypothetical protein